MRLLIDTNDNTDVNNIYLPETNVAANGVATVDLSGVTFPIANVDMIGFIEQDGASYNRTVSALSDVSLESSELETVINSGVLNNARFNVTYNNVSKLLTFTTVNQTGSLNTVNIKFYIRVSNGFMSKPYDGITIDAVTFGSDISFDLILSSSDSSLGKTASSPLFELPIGFTASEFATLIAQCYNGEILTDNPVDWLNGVVINGDVTPLGTAFPFTSVGGVGNINDLEAVADGEVVRFKWKDPTILKISDITVNPQSSVNVTISAGSSDTAKIGTDGIVTGGSLSQATPELTSIIKARKSYYTNNKLYLKGFGGFIGIANTPISQDSQDDFFTLTENVVSVTNTKSIGFSVDIETIEDGTSFFMCAFPINSLDNKIETIWGSPVNKIPIIIEIKRNATNLQFILKRPNTPTFKNSTDGYTFLSSSTLGQLPYEPNHTYEFLYPHSGSLIAQLIKKNIGATVVDNFINVDATSNNFTLTTSLNDIIDDKTFTLFHVLANDGADAVITNIVVKGD